MNELKDKKCEHKEIEWVDNGNPLNPFFKCLKCGKIDYNKNFVNIGESKFAKLVLKSEY